MNLVRLQYGGGGGELHGASITVNTEESTLVGKEALLYKVSDLSTIINRAVFSALSSDGVSTATFNNIIEPDTYIVKTSDGTDEGNTSNIEITSDDIINKTTLVRSLSLNLELNVTFYSAPGETIKYKRQNSDELILLGKADNAGEGNGTIICKEGETITFSGDIAKDTTTGTTAYSKDITLTSDTTEIYVMPDDVLYWYGYFASNVGDMKDLGYSSPYGTVTQGVKNTNYFSASCTGTEIKGIITNNLIDLTKKTTLKGIYSVFGWEQGDTALIGILPSKTAGDASVFNNTHHENSKKLISADLSSVTSGFPCTTAYGCTQNVYALWLE